MVLTLSRQFVTLTGTGKAVRVFYLACQENSSLVKKGEKITRTLHTEIMHLHLWLLYLLTLSCLRFVIKVSKVGMITMVAMVTNVNVYVLITLFTLLPLLKMFICLP